MDTTQKGEMMADNAYFNFSNPVRPGMTIQSGKYNNDFYAIERAFSALPDPNQLVSSYNSYGVSSGTATAYRVTLPAFDESFGYVEGMQVLMKAHLTNTGPATLSVNGLPAVDLVNLTVGLGPLIAGDIRIGAVYSLRYDGEKFQVANSPGNVIAQMMASAQQAAASAQQALVSAQQAEASAQQAANAVASPAFTTAVIGVLMNTSLRPGVVKTFIASLNPNTMYPGTSWVTVGVPGASYTTWRRVL